MHKFTRYREAGEALYKGRQYTEYAYSFHSRPHTVVVRRPAKPKVQSFHWLLSATVFQAKFLYLYHLYSRKYLK